MQSYHIRAYKMSLYITLKHGASHTTDFAAKQYVMHGKAVRSAVRTWLASASCQTCQCLHSRYPLKWNLLSSYHWYFRYIIFCLVTPVFTVSFTTKYFYIIWFIFCSNSGSVVALYNVNNAKLWAFFISKYSYTNRTEKSTMQFVHNYKSQSSLWLTFQRGSHMEQFVSPGRHCSQSWGCCLFAVVLKKLNDSIIAFILVLVI